jgi:hypothetical protein
MFLNLTFYKVLLECGKVGMAAVLGDSSGFPSRAVIESFANWEGPIPEKWAIAPIHESASMVKAICTVGAARIAKLSLGEGCVVWLPSQ